MWSLFGRKRSHRIVVYGLMWDRLRPPNMDLSNLCIKGIRKPQNGCNKLLTPTAIPNKKRDIPERISLYKVLGFNKLLAQCASDIHCDSATVLRILVFLEHQPPRLYRYFRNHHLYVYQNRMRIQTATMLLQWQRNKWNYYEH